MWTARPVRARPGVAARRANTPAAWGKGTPNLVSPPPVVIFACPPPPTSGFTRSATRCDVPRETASRASSTPSSSLSRFRQPTPASSAWVELGGRLAHAGEHDVPGAHPRRQRPGQLPARHHVRPEALGRQQRQHRAVGVRLAREVTAGGRDGGAERTRPVPDRRARGDVGGRAHGRRDMGQRHAVQVEHAVHQGQRPHQSGGRSKRSG